MAKLLEVQELRTAFTSASGVVRAVNGVSWDVEEGETVALVGESGCGKSVSALSIMRLIDPPAGRIESGKVIYKGRDLLKQVRIHLVETARPLRAAMVHDVTGVKVVSLHHDISTRTGSAIAHHFRTAAGA